MTIVANPSFPLFVEGFCYLQWPFTREKQNNLRPLCERKEKNRPCYSSIERLNSGFVSACIALNHTSECLGFGSILCWNLKTKNSAPDKTTWKCGLSFDREIWSSIRLKQSGYKTTITEVLGMKSKAWYFIAPSLKYRIIVLREIAVFYGMSSLLFFNRIFIYNNCLEIQNPQMS